MGLFKLFKELVFPSIPSSSNDEFLDSMKKNENSNDNIDNQSEELKGKVENQKEKEKEKENFIHPRRLFPKKHVHPHGYVQFSAGMDPYTITNLNPTIKDCIKIFGTYEYGIILLTGYIPAYLVYRDHSKNDEIYYFYRKFKEGRGLDWCSSRIRSWFHIWIDA